MGHATPTELKPVAECLLVHPSSLHPPPASEEGSESEGSESSGRSCRNERSIQEKLQVLMAEGLLPAVKVFLDWLRTNPDLIVVCAQVCCSTALVRSRSWGRALARMGPRIPIDGPMKIRIVAKCQLCARLLHFLQED